MTKDRILIVDDEADIALILKLQLEGAGYKTTRAKDGLEALEHLAKESYDLVLLDIKMPRMDGLEVLKRIQEEMIDAAVVMMTAHGSESVAVKAMQQGALDYVAKPFATDEILQKAERAIEFHRTAKENKRLQRAVEEERNMLEAIFQGMAELLVAVDADGKVVVMNRMAEQLLGISLAHATGKPVEQVIFTDIPPEKLPCRQALANGEPCLDAAYTIKTGRQEIPVLSSASILTDSRGAVRGSVEIIRDISARVALEEEKKDFVSMLSHDLKSPITAIVGSIDLVREERLGPLAESQKEFLDTAVESCAEMVEMIDTLLDIHKFEAGKMELKLAAEDISLLVEKALSGFSVVAKAGEISLESVLQEGIPPVVLDRGKVLRLLNNLISNAIKFTHSGGRIQVGARLVDDLGEVRERIPKGCYDVEDIRCNGKYLVLEVKDSGVGIPADALGTIFDRFVQAKNRREGKTRGTGLGLAFCRKVMDVHQGYIWAESEEGKGSLFTVLFPLNIL